MATQEKLLKSIEILKKLCYTNNVSDSGNLKKEKIQHCHVISDCISSSMIQIAPNFPMLLNYTMETIFQLCDDPDSDIRMVAEESFNKIIRAMNDENITKVLIELHKEIKRNNSAKSLRAALSRFSKLAHCIRPHKGKPYVLNLFPSMIKIIDRPEEAIHETLSNDLPRIIEVLGPFTTDSDIKNLLKSFMANISNPSAVIKRTTANCIQNICLNCRKPYLSIVYCIHILLGFMFPLNENCDSHLILGVFGVLRILLPHWRNFLRKQSIKQEKEKLGTEWGELKADKLQQIYELCLYYLNHKDHNIVNYSLETLNVLLQNSTKELKAIVLNPLGMPRSKSELHVPNKRKSSSQLSIASGSALLETSNPLESELTDSIRPDIAKWIDESKLSIVDLPLRQTKDSLEKSQSVDNGSTNIMTRSFSQIELGSSIDVESLKTCENNISMDHLEMSTNSSEKSFSYEDIPETFAKEIDIGQFNDQDIPLKYCTRLLAKSFLLTGTPGHLINDRNCRISVKSSALSCISSILRLYPKILLEYLDSSVSEPQKEVDQPLSDILLYSDHSDPQLRGNTRILIANYIVSVITQIRRNDDCEMAEENLKLSESNLNFGKLTSAFISGLADQSSLCVRHTLQSLELCLGFILESEHCRDAVPILHALPVLANNPYWLVKVNLCDLVCSLPYVTIHYVIGGNQFQNQVLYGIIFELLKDSDVRVRNASSNSLAKLIPHLYYEEHSSENTITSKAINYRKLLLSNLYSKSWLNPSNFEQLIETMPFPFNKIDETPSENVEIALSKVISDIYGMIPASNCRFTILGCIETLASLSQIFPCTTFKTAWRCCIPRGGSESDQTNDLFKLCVHLMNSSVLVYEIGFHTNLLVLASNLYAGHSVSILRPIPEDDLTKKWNMFESAAHSNLSDLFLKHIVKILSIYQHIVDDLHSPSLHPKPIILSLPTSSPIKRRKSDLEKKFISPSKILEEKSERKEKEKNMVGGFSHLPHYVKMHEALKTAYGNYKTSLEPAASQKFLNMLKESLKSLSILMEIGSLSEFGSIAEEILNYLSSIFRIEPSATVECVQQLLKSIFGTNLLANGVDILQELSKADKDHNLSNGLGFYNQIFVKPYNEVSMCINSLKDINKIECDGDSTVMGYLHRSTKRKAALARNLDKVLTNYIRIFEPMVIKSLKQYTITSDVKLQGRVLQLLSQLVQLKINYCLLDADQIFMNFVINQFEYIEEGQIQHSEELVPKIFQFLVQLSYSKQHSKSIISVPKIIQLCDGLIASGQCPLTHCIPALKPIVEDIFLTRNNLNTSDIAELETTREVVLSMLLKLVKYHEVVDLIILILDDSKYCSDTDKWLRWSQQVLGAFISVLKVNKYKLDTTESFNSLRKLIFTMNPNVFRPIDDIVVMLFQEPPCLDQDISCFTRWMGKILTILIILSPVKEDIILSKITSLKNNFVPNSVFENVVITPDPLNVTNSADFFQYLSPEIILIRFIFRTLTLASNKCTMIVEEGDDVFFIEELSIFMMFCLHNFQSGFLCKTANVAISIIEKSKYAEECDAISLDPINENFHNLIFFYPTLTFQWCYFLTLLSYEDRNFWSLTLKLPKTKNNMCHSTSHSINTEVVKVGGSIALCDYLCENSTKETDVIYWLIKHNVNLLISWNQEAPINEFISFIHRDPKFSQVLLTTIEQQSLKVEDLIFKLKVLKCIENAHPNLTGQLIHLLLAKLLCVQESAVSKEVSKLSTGKLELLLTMPVDSVHRQLSKESLIEVVSYLTQKNSNTKHEALLALLNKLGSTFYGLNLQNAQIKTVDPNFIKNLEIDKTWYLSQVKSKLGRARIGKEVAEILSVLSYEEQLEIMRSEHFDKLILKNCIEYGVNICKNNLSKEVPEVLRAAVDCLYIDISSIVNNSLPEPQQGHEVFVHQLESQSISEFNEKFSVPEFSKILHSIIPCVSSYLESIPYIPSLELRQEDPENALKFGVLSLEYINYLIQVKKYLNINIIDYTFRCFDCILKQNSLFNVLNSENYSSWSCSAVSSINKITEYLLKSVEPLTKIGNSIPKEIVERFDKSSVGEASRHLYSLFYWLNENKTSQTNIPDFLLVNLNSIIISLGRLSIFNCFMLVPTRAWNKGWEPSTIPSQNPVSLLPVELLQEVGILEEYIFRINLLGWTSRQQFEETWMCLLSVLCNNPSDDSSAEEINELFTSTSLAVKGITSMLFQTLYDPVPGKGNISELIHVSRDATIVCDKVSLKKLKDVQLFIKTKYNTSPYFSEKSMKIDCIFDDVNLEKQSNAYSSSQMSIKYFLIAVGILEDIDHKCSAYRIWNRRDEILQKQGLDVTSCLHFLQDFYTQLLQLQKINSLILLHEIVNSILVLSDLFNDKTQFSWMLDLFLGLLKVHAVEDELLHQYLIVGACKAAAVLNPELETYETIKKYLVQFLKSPLLPSRIACLRGLLYILEGCKLSNISIGGISEELQMILPCAVEYIQMNLNISNGTTPQSQEHTLLVWATAFYITENIDEAHIESTFVENVLNNAISVLSQAKINMVLYKCIMKGLQRIIVLKKSVLEKIGKKVVKLSLDGLKKENPFIAILSMQLLFTYLYTECAEHVETQDEQTSPENLVQTIEKFSALFEHIKRGYNFEVEIVCSLLPQVLDDFFTPADILTKVICEFLSTQQPHQRLLSRVVFHLFQNAIRQNQLTLLQDWVVFSLPNFTQNFSYPMATWCLTCFFISASCNKWLTSLFPYVQTRMQRYEHEDREMLCIAGSDFYKNLSTEKQKQTFRENFKIVRNLPAMPFNDLLSSL